MEKRYKATTELKAARPRSERLRDIPSAAAAVALGVASGGSALTEEQAVKLDSAHAHKNKELLDKLVEANGYLCQMVRSTYSDGTVTDLPAMIKVGFSDFARYAIEATSARSAGALDANSPTREDFVNAFKDDEAFGHITFNGGLTATSATVDNLFVRMKAVFEELDVVKAKTLGGKQYITPGGSVECVEVEELTDRYRCYFVSEMNEARIDCLFVADDLAISKTFNTRTGRAYWRKVLDVVQTSEHSSPMGHICGYVDLSKVDCTEGSDVPMAGDVICQLGHVGADPVRQGAMVLSTVDGDSPSLKLYSGISNFSLEGRAVVSFGMDEGGLVFFRLGATGAKKYLDYRQEAGLSLSGSLTSENAADGEPIAQIREDGTAYFAGNTLRMERNAMLVGDYVRLDKDGLSLYEDKEHSAVRLQVVNSKVAPIIKAAMDASETTKETEPVNIPVAVTKSRSGLATITGRPIYTIPSAAVSTSFSLGSIAGGTMIHGPIIVTAPDGTKCSVRVDVKMGAVLLASFYSSELAQSHTVQVSYTHVTETSGAAELTVSIVGEGGVGEFSRNDKVRIYPNITVSRSAKSLTVLGNDGFVTAWGKALIALTKDNIQLISGTSKLTLSTYTVDGVEKSSVNIQSAGVAVADIVGGHINVQISRKDGTGATVKEWKSLDEVIRKVYNYTL